MTNKKRDELFIGIDLGTSRSSIATSTDQRHMVESYVGWPVDMVAKKVLKKDVLIGREALENRTMLDLHRPLERGLIREGSERDQEAVRQLLRHLLSVSGVEKAREEGFIVYAVVGVPAEALRVNRESLREAMKGLVDGLIVVSEPFAVAYGLEALLHAMVIDVGAGTTDFCVMNGRYPTEDDQRTLPNAGDWVDDQLATQIAERHPEVKVSIHTIRQWKESWGFVGNAKNPITVSVPVNGKPTEINIAKELSATCSALVPPIAETMIDLIASVEAEYQERVRNQIILAGGTSAMRGLSDALQASLTDLGGGRIQVVEDPVFCGSNGGLVLAQDAPRKDWEKLGS